jgi:hypothetical protein
MLKRSGILKFKDFQNGPVVIISHFGGKKYFYERSYVIDVKNILWILWYLFNVYKISQKYHGFITGYKGFRVV